MNKKKVFLVLLLAFLVCIPFVLSKEPADQSKSVKQTTPEYQIKLEQEKLISWNQEKTFQDSYEGFTFSAYKSVDGAKSWIYLVKMEPSQGSITTLKFPDQIDGAVVTRIGFDKMSLSNDEAEDGDICVSIFGSYLEPYHNCGGYIKGLEKIKEMILPSELIQIDEYSFSSIYGLTKLTIPKKVLSINTEAFYECKNLAKVSFSGGALNVGWGAFELCNRLTSFTTSKGNGELYTKNGLLIVKEDERLLAVPSGLKHVEIPDGVRIIGKGCMYTSLATKLSIPRSVNSIEPLSIYASDLQSVHLDERNETYGMDGSSLYHKPDYTLVLGVVNNKKLKIANRIKEINEDTMVVGDHFVTNVGAELEVIDIPASVTTVRGNWHACFRDSMNQAIYFRGRKPPQLVDKEEDGYAELPVFIRVFVPEDSVNDYTEWYRKNHCLEYLDKGIESIK